MRGVTLVWRLGWCAVGATIGLGVALAVVERRASPFLLASLGGSTVFVFGMTRAPAAQPRALFGGHVGGTLIGALCSRLFGDALWVSVVAVVLTLVFMLVTRTVHPPAGADPLIMVHEHAGMIAVWNPVLLSIIVLALIGAIWSRLGPRIVPYPVSWFEPSPPRIDWGWLE